MSAISNIRKRLIAQIAAQFKNGGKNKNAIAENLERLEWFGILLCHQEGQVKHWQHIEI
jgi:hypothetical protein